MRRTILLAMTAVCCIMVSAQTHMRIWQNGEDNRMSIAKVGEMTVSGSLITIKNEVYDMDDIDSIVIVPEVRIQYAGDIATVSVTPNADITATVDGAHVTLTNNNVSNECEIILSGQSSNGSLTYNGSYKTTLFLDGLNLTSQVGSPLDIECGKRISLVLNDGTANRLADAANGQQKACLYCKGHLEIEGSGSLSIAGNAKHALSTKEYLQLKRSTGTITIDKAASDAIHCGEYFQMNGGTLSINAQTMGDAIQVDTELLDDGTIDGSVENNGQIIIKGGSITAVVSQQDCKGLKCDGAITISGGNIEIAAQGNGSRGVQTDGLVTINENDQTTIINITATGYKCTLEECEDDPHRCVGMKLDGGLLMQAGSLTVTAPNSGSTKARSIQLPAGGYTKTGGTVTVNPAMTIK